MLTYSPDKKSHWLAIGKRMLYASILALVIFAAWIYFTDNNYFWFIPLYLLVIFVDQLNKEWIQDIQINEENKTISYHYRSPLNGDGEKVHILSQVQLYTKTRKTKDNQQEISTLSLYKQRRKVMELNTRSNTFTPETLNSIREQLLRLGVTE